MLGKNPIAQHFLFFMASSLARRRFRDARYNKVNRVQKSARLLLFGSVIIVLKRHRDRGDGAFAPHWMDNAMSKIDALKAEIESLPSEEVAEIFRWLSEKDWEAWDKEIAADSEAGKLDFLTREAREDKGKGTLRDL